MSFFLVAGFASALRADVVVLADGNEIRNVRVIYQSGRVNLIRQDGGIQSYARSDVRAVIEEPVAWQIEMDEAEFARRMQGRIDKVVTRIRTEESLREDRRRRYLFGAGVRAVVAPGWHKIQRGDPRFGGLVMAGAALSAAHYWWRAKLFARAQKDYADVLQPSLSFAALSNSNAIVDPFILVNYVIFRDRGEVLRTTARQLDIAAVFSLVLWTVNFAETMFQAWSFEAPPTSSSAREIAEPVAVESGWAWSNVAGIESGPRIRFGYTERF